MSATKSNGINYTMPFWDEVVQDLAQEYSDIKVSSYHIDALAAYFVLRPKSLDVVVGSNLFGDILSDLGAAMAGGIANPKRPHQRRFNGATAFQPWIGRAPLLLSRTSRRFNGATAFQPWIARAGSNGSAWSTCRFNGATAFQP